MVYMAICTKETQAYEAGDIIFTSAALFVIVKDLEDKGFEPDMVEIYEISLSGPLSVKDRIRSCGVRRLKKEEYSKESITRKWSEHVVDSVQ